MDDVRGFLATFGILVAMCLGITLAISITEHYFPGAFPLHD